jgi:hypothetical protein
MPQAHSPITIAGAGPAGSAAALAALGEGAQVILFEKSHFPRQKVCGEFLSPEIQPVLESLGAWRAFLAASPSSIRSVRLHFRDSEKSWRLPIPAFGLSRYRLDTLLLDCAIARGAEVIRKPFPPASEPCIVAYGRKGIAAKGQRLFGFKAHFSGPLDDAVELFFLRNAYAGVSAVEAGQTNVCGLVPESLLGSLEFEIDNLIRSWPPLAGRLRPLSRTMDWLITGPLVFDQDLRISTGDPVYRTGDALGFIDPFTGSGILSAVLTGKLAGTAAARRTPHSEYQRQCVRALRFQYWFSGIVRWGIQSGLAEMASRFLPGDLLFRLTRPCVALK